MICNCYLYISEVLADKTVYFFTSHLEITTSVESGFSDIRFKKETRTFQSAINKVNRQKDMRLLQWFVENLFIYRNIKSFVQRINKAESYFQPYENLYVHTIYMIGWSYIIWFGLSLVLL
jgi:hypothetical protein